MVHVHFVRVLSAREACAKWIREMSVCSATPGKGLVMLSAFAVGASGMLLQPPLRPTAAVACPMAYRCPALVASEGRKNMLGGLFGKVIGKDASSSLTLQPCGRFFVVHPYAYYMIG